MLISATMPITSSNGAETNAISCLSFMACATFSMLR